MKAWLSVGGWLQLGLKNEPLGENGRKILGLGVWQNRFAGGFGVFGVFGGKAEGFAKTFGLRKSLKSEGPWGAVSWSVAGS